MAGMNKDKDTVVGKNKGGYFVPEFTALSLFFFKSLSSSSSYLFIENKIIP